MVYCISMIISFIGNMMKEKTYFTAIQVDLGEMLLGQLTSSVHHHWNFVNLAKISCAILSY